MSKRILYIEDNPDNRLLIRRVLQVEGYEVLEAIDGQTGMQLAAEVQPDLILMDINLPEIDGYEVTARLKQLPGLGFRSSERIALHLLVEKPARLPERGTRSLRSSRPPSHVGRTRVRSNV